MPIARMTTPKRPYVNRFENWQSSLEATPCQSEDSGSQQQQVQRIKNILRLGLVSLIGYELVQRTSQAKPYKSLIDVIRNQRIALCHSLIKCSQGGLNGSEPITVDEAEFRNAWTRTIKVAELEDRRNLVTELEHVESLLEQFACDSLEDRDDSGETALREVVSAARGCREVWSLIAFVNEDNHEVHPEIVPLND